MVRSATRTLPSYDAATLERAALDYAARYATTRARLGAYLHRKLRERGWSGDGDAPVAALVERFADHGYVDDRAFATARAGALIKRGYGGRRIGAALRAAGIDAEIAESLKARIDAGAGEAAMRFARRKRIGPFFAGSADPAQKRRWIAMMARAGHPMDQILRVLDIMPGEEDIDTVGASHDRGAPESE